MVMAMAGSSLAKFARWDGRTDGKIKGEGAFQMEPWNRMGLLIYPKAGCG